MMMMMINISSYHCASGFVYALNYLEGNQFEAMKSLLLEKC